MPGLLILQTISLDNCFQLSLKSNLSATNISRVLSKDKKEVDTDESLSL